MGDLVAPRERSALVAALAGRPHERDPNVVDGERMGLQRTDGGVWGENLAACLDPVADRLTASAPWSMKCHSAGGESVAACLVR